MRNLKEGLEALAKCEDEIKERIEGIPDYKQFWVIAHEMFVGFRNALKVYHFGTFKTSEPTDDKPEILHKGFCDDGPSEGDGRISIISFLTGTDLAKNNADARRMVKAGAVILNGRRKMDPNARILLSTEGHLLRSGKTKRTRVYLVSREPDALKNPEPADTLVINNCIMTDAEGNLVGSLKTQPHVRNPDGRVWLRCIEPSSGIPYTVVSEKLASHERYLTPAEAFRPEAIVQATEIEDGESVTGRMTHGYDGKIYVTCFDQEFCFRPYELTLVKPAPEE